MNRMIRGILLVAITCLFYLCLASLSYGAGGYSKGEICVISASSNGITCSLSIMAARRLHDPGGKVDFSLKAYTNTDRFTAYEGVHKRHALYRYIGTREEKFNIDNSISSGSRCTAILGTNGKYKIVAMSRFVWETEMGKVSEGFPRYHSNYVVSEPMYLSLADIDEIISKGGGSHQSETEKPAHIIGQVGHTDGWNRNRNEYNNRCGPKKRRSSDMFWPGEKFILSCNIGGSDGAEYVNVTIEGSKYKTRLRFENGSWRGVLFDDSMIDQWRRARNKELTFIFESQVGKNKIEDRVAVIVDGSDEYWKMHRKE
jgi:hypothetical protein